MCLLCLPYPPPPINVSFPKTDEAVVAARTALASLKASPDTTAFEYGKEVMEKLRSLHMVLGTTMEQMLQVQSVRVVKG